MKKVLLTFSHDPATGLQNYMEFGILSIETQIFRFMRKSNSVPYIQYTL